MTTSSCWVRGYNSTPSPTVQSTPVNRTVEQDSAVLQTKLIYSRGQNVNVHASGAEVWDSNSESVKADTAFPTAHHRCAIYSKKAELHGRADRPR